ncbi:WD40 repeat domain-containing protein [bacterium]|nr:WD40 repeat domain-containing protein [bacterium]
MRAAPARRRALAVAFLGAAIGASGESRVLAGEPTDDPLPSGAIARRGSARFRHPDLHALAFSPEGTVVSLGSTRKNLEVGAFDVRTWDAASGKELGKTLVESVPMSGTVQLSPDGKTVALLSCEKERLLRLWDARTGKETAKVAPWKGNFAGDNWSGSVSFSPDGKTIAAQGEWACPTVVLLDRETGKVLRELSSTSGKRAVPEREQGVKSIAFSPDGKVLLVHSQVNAVRWAFETASGRELWTGEADDSCAFSPDGKVLASGSWKTIRLLEPLTGKEVSRCDAVDDESYRAVSSLAFSPDGRTLATWEGRKAIRLLDAATLKPVRAVEAPGGRPGLLAFSPDGKTLLSWTQLDDDQPYRIDLWDVATGKAQAVAATRGEAPSQPTFSGEGKRLAWIEGERVHVLDLASMSEPLALEGHRAQVLAVEVSPDGKTVASGDAAGKVSLWETATGKGRVDLSVRHLPVALGFGGDGKTLLSADPYARLRAFDAATGKRTRIVVSSDDRGDPDDGSRHKESFPVVSQASFFRDRKKALLFVGVAAWVVDLGKEKFREKDVRALAVEEDKELAYGRSVSLSPDEKLLAVGDGSGTIRILDVASGAELKKLSPAKAKGAEPEKEEPGGKRRRSGDDVWASSPLAFSPDGRLLAFSGEESIAIWDVAAGREVEKLKARASVVRFSPDGAVLAAAGLEATVRLWDAKTWAERRPLAGHKEAVLAISFSPDGKTLVSGSADTTVVVWDLGGR